MAANLPNIVQRQFHETESEREARTAAGFPDVEGSLPKHIGSRFDIPFLDNVTSFFGHKNVLAQEVDPKKEVVWLLDNTAYRTVSGTSEERPPWEAEFVVAYFTRDSGKNVSGWVAGIADTLALGKQGENRAETEATIAERLIPFVNTIQPARFVNVRFPDGDTQKLGPGGRNAISSDIVGTTGDHKDGATLQITAIPPDIAPHGSMLMHFAEPRGWTVVSDIDDSIKITMTMSPIGIIRSTFVSTPTPVAGMPELYEHINSHLSPSWFYLSASPYNLYTFLRPFLHQYYPKGTIILRDASWMNLGGFLQSLTQGTEEYKASRMDKIHDWLPKRKILCVGDSTQSDPEAYGAMYRKYPGWVKAIFIRKVVGVAEMEKTDKNMPARFEKAFQHVPKGIWRLFEDPSELYAAVDSLKAL
ncbi:hypothetical protein MMC26_005506 [Xylographa opegraphella]|nr:hypothetical protein [Xylographa opegraphella]